MKKFLHYLTEQQRPHETKLPRLLGELRLAGIHAGDRDSRSPFVATRSMMALSGAAQRIQGVLLPYGLFIGEPHVVVREEADHVRMKFHVYSTDDDTRRIGNLDVLGEVNPIDKGTMQFRADLKFAPDFLF